MIIDIKIRRKDVKIKGSDLKKIIREEISRSIQSKGSLLKEAAIPQGLIDSAHRKLNSILGQFPFALEPAVRNLRMMADSESPLTKEFAALLNGPYGRTNQVDVGNKVVIGLIAGKAGMGGSLIQTIGTMGYNMYGLDFDGTQIPSIINSSEVRSARDELLERMREIVNFGAVEEPDEINHLIKSGDTLSQLAQRYGTTVSAIMDRNRLRSDLIVAGKNLIIPQ